MSDTEEVVANLTHAEINACSFDNWFPVFDSIKPRVTLRSAYMQLTHDFISYLHEDGVVIPNSIVTGKYNAEFSDEEEDEKYPTQEEEYAREFPDIQNFIADTIEEFDGAVFPKLNWSAPRDAQWILSDSKLLKCTHTEDVFLVLKSSQFISHDLDDAYNNVKEGDTGDRLAPILVLRKWYDIHPSMEFRCFIRNKNLVAISQRDESNFYDYLLEKKDEYKTKLIDFWNEKVKHLFPLENYSMDTYITRTGNVIIIDFNVYGPPTQSYLFEWNQTPLLVTEDVPTAPEMRIVTSQSGVMKPSLQTYGGVPSDFFESENVEKMVQFMEKQRNESD